MTTRIIIATAALAVFLGAAPIANAQGTREDEDAIRKVIIEMTEGFSKHDALASTRMYTSDADLVTVRGERFRGTREFQKGLAQIFDTRAREAALRTLNVSVRFIRPDNQPTCCAKVFDEEWVQELEECRLDWHIPGAMISSCNSASADSTHANQHPLCAAKRVSELSRIDARHTRLLEAVVIL